jgi:hypothetical protein
MESAMSTSPIMQAILFVTVSSSTVACSPDSSYVEATVGTGGSSGATDASTSGDPSGTEDSSTTTYGPEPVAVFEIPERLELCTNVHRPVPQSRREALARNVRLTVEPYTVEVWTLGSYEFDEREVPVGPIGETTLMEPPFSHERPNEDLMPELDPLPTSSAAYYQVLDGFNDLLEPAEGTYTLRRDYTTGDRPAVRFDAQIHDGTPPLVFSFAYDAFASTYWRMGSAAGPARPCDRVVDEERTIRYTFEGATIETSWRFAEVDRLDRGAGGSLVVAMKGVVNGREFQQTDPMKLAAKGLLTSTGISSNQGGWTGLDGDGCVVWFETGEAPEVLEVMNCAFEVVEELLFVDSEVVE